MATVVQGWWLRLKDHSDPLLIAMVILIVANALGAGLCAYAVRGRVAAHGVLGPSDRSAIAPFRSGEIISLLDRGSDVDRAWLSSQNLFFPRRSIAPAPPPSDNSLVLPSGLNYYGCVYSEDGTGLALLTFAPGADDILRLAPGEAIPGTALTVSGIEAERIMVSDPEARTGVLMAKALSRFDRERMGVDEP